MNLLAWFRRLISGAPHFVIGTTESPYLLRWFLIPRNRFVNVYLHKFMRDDDDRALHDHPWNFVSIMLRGRYVEVVEEGWDPEQGGLGVWRQREVKRSAPSIAFRRAEHRHRVVLDRGRFGNPTPCWTIVITGPNVRSWGFWCPQGFVPWEYFVAENPGEIGRGCEQ